MAHKSFDDEHWSKSYDKGNRNGAIATAKCMVKSSTFDNTHSYAYEQ